MLTYNKCLNPLCSYIVLVIFLLFSMFNLSHSQKDNTEKEMKIKNILEREKSLQEEDDWRNENIYTIHSKIDKYYSNVTEIYISVIDIKLRNTFIISENITEEYYRSYDSLLGPTVKLFPLQELEQINSTHAEFSLEENIITISHKNKSEILIHSIETISENYSTKFFFMRNFFVSNFMKFDYENCDKKNILSKIISELKFFDAHMLLYEEYFKNCIDMENEKTLFYDSEGKIIYSNRKIDFIEDTNLLYQHLIKENKEIATKIKRKTILNQTLRKILDKKESEVIL